MDDRLLPIARLWKTYGTKMPYGYMAQAMVFKGSD